MLQLLRVTRSDSNGWVGRDEQACRMYSRQAYSTFFPSPGTGEGADSLVRPVARRPGPAPAVPHPLAGVIDGPVPRPIVVPGRTAVPVVAPTPEVMAASAAIAIVPVPVIAAAPIRDTVPRAALAGHRLGGADRSARGRRRCRPRQPAGHQPQRQPEPHHHLPARPSAR